MNIAYNKEYCLYDYHTQKMDKPKSGFCLIKKFTFNPELKDCTVTFFRTKKEAMDELEHVSSSVNASICNTKKCFVR